MIYTVGGTDNVRILMDRNSWIILHRYRAVQPCEVTWLVVAVMVTMS